LESESLETFDSTSCLMQPFFKLGLIGYPLGHSLSPKIQNAALNSCGLDGDYSLFLIRPEDKQGLQDLLARVRSGEITGLNVTIPHKQNVIALVDELTPTAQAVGAVNAIYVRGNRLIGENTDATGFLSDLKSKLTMDSRRDGDSRALVLGAGGSARAVVYALANDDWNVTVAARRTEQAVQLASSFPNHEFQISNIESLDPELSYFQLIVNTTPIGMFPHVDQSPLPDDVSLPNGTMIYDLIYNPRVTKLMREARAQGLAATSGLGMLVEQAALGFELWTGQRPSLDILWNAVNTDY
jgi:shikimate dehydrogenase